MKPEAKLVSQWWIAARAATLIALHPITTVFRATPIYREIEAAVLGRLIGGAISTRLLTVLLSGHQHREYGKKNRKMLQAPSC